MAKQISNKKKSSGFTIIEVALVLAIAALIFLVVFLAVPALQRNQRDDARKRDVSNVVEAVTSYTANKNAAPGAGVPWKSGAAVAAEPLSTYLSNLSGNVDYVVVSNAGATTFSGTQAATPAATGGTSTAPSVPMINAIVVYTGTKCNDDNTAVVAGTTRGFTATIPNKP